MNGTEELKVGVGMNWGAGGGFFSLAATVGVLASLGFSCTALAGLTYSEATVSLASVDSSGRLVPGCFTKVL